MSYTIVSDVCAGCGDCIAACPVDCIHWVDKHATERRAYINDQRCIDCGACLAACPTEGAILDEWKPELQRSSDISDAPAAGADDPPQEERDLDALVLLSSGMDCFKNGQYDAAIERYSLAMKLTTKYADLFPSLRGDAYKAKADHDRALADYNTSIALNPAQVRAYMERGDLYERVGDRARAIADFQKALANNPDMLPQFVKECEDALKRLGTMH